MAAAQAGEGSSGRTVWVWIEDAEGAIVRGQTDSVTSCGACVRLAERPAFEVGYEVALRLCFEQGADTVALRARVRFVRSADGAAECGLEWTPSASQGAALAPWITSAT